MGSEMWMRARAKATVTLTEGKMKARRAHVVRLSRQVLELFRELRSITGSKGYIFPAFHTSQSPMSENTVNAAFRRMGFTKDAVTAHDLHAVCYTHMTPPTTTRI